MTTWGDSQIRHDLWLRLRSVADELHYIAEQWLLADLDMREAEDIHASMPDQYELPLNRPVSGAGDPSGA